MTPLDPKVLGILYEKNGEDIDRLLDFVKESYTTSITPQDSMEETARRVYESYAAQNAVEEVRRIWRSCLKKSI